MRPALLPAPIPETIAELHPDLPDHIFTPAFKTACLILDRFVGALAVEIARDLGLEAGTTHSLDSLLAQRKWSDAGRPALRWLFETLTLYGHATPTADGWQLESLSLPTPSAAIESEALASCPHAAPAYEVLRIAAAALPAVLAGTSRGEDALFGARTLSLWFSYFSNENPHYAPANAICATAVARAVPGAARLLEVGGGGGSAGLAIAQELAARGKPPAFYLFTELQPAFLRRGARLLQPILGEHGTFVAKTYDINQDPGGLGIEEESLDAVVAVNTLHLASDLVLTLHRLSRLLRPGGALVLGEVMRPEHTGTVHLELPFALLDSYARVQLDENLRPRPGFLTVRQWQRALEGAGLHEITVLPAAIQRCAELYPGFYAGAVMGRR
jgi:SAM-dependent methyltransferase